MEKLRFCLGFASTCDVAIIVIIMIERNVVACMLLMSWWEVQKKNQSSNDRDTHHQGNDRSISFDIDNDNVCDCGYVVLSLFC